VNAPQKPGWLARIVLTLTTVGLVIVGFFFLTAALVAGALIALVFGARLWWTIRKLKRAAADAPAYNNAPGGARDNRGALDGEYQVIERESAGGKLPPSASNTPPAP
jgi:predicted lipid-binding transport protein (Tim44 family)